MRSVAYVIIVDKEIHFYEKGWKVVVVTFMEYKVEAHRVEEYRAYMRGLAAEHSELEWYEGTDQPHLFVELWRADSIDAAERTKKERQRERSSWSNKVHAWTFQRMG